MNENARKENNFIAYEYKDVIVSRKNKTLYEDNYACFGWEKDASSYPPGISRVSLRFKRNRKINNKAELTRLQREFDNQIKQMEKLEESKYIAPSIVSYSVGLIGTAFLAGATFSYLAGMILLCIVLAIPGFIGWIIPYFAYQKIKRNKTEKMVPLIDQIYDTIYDICEKANNLGHHKINTYPI